MYHMYKAHIQILLQVFRFDREIAKNIIFLPFISWTLKHPDL